MQRRASPKKTFNLICLPPSRRRSPRFFLLIDATFTIWRSNQKCRAENTGEHPEAGFRGEFPLTLVQMRTISDRRALNGETLPISDTLFVKRTVRHDWSPTGHTGAQTIRPLFCGYSFLYVLLSICQEKKVDAEVS